MQSGTMSAENNLQSFSMVLKLVDVQGGDLPPSAPPGGSTPGREDAAANKPTDTFRESFESLA
jgi:hypothetical protein